MCYACGSSTHQTPRSVDCSEHKCATCQGELEPKGHNHKNCPLAQCDACNLSGHIADVCTFRQCYDVEVDYLNLLLLTKGRNTIDSYFDANGQACIQPNALRIHGKFTESTDWDDVKQRFAITDRQVLELKSVAYEFKRTTTQEYNRAQRDVNHPSNAPIHFAFPEFQTDPNGTTRPTDYDRDITKCSICKTWKFPQEMGRKKWCCKGGNLIDVITPWTQPTADFRQLCLNMSRLATEFRFHCRQFNNEVSFASYGINYGKEEDLPTPSFIKISGHIYSRLLNAEDDGALIYYVHDATYRRDKKLPLETLRIVRDCISAKNNLAQELRRFSQMPNMEELIVTIETNPSNIGAPDVAALYVRTKGDTTTHPRRLVIYPTRKSFRHAHPDLDDNVDLEIQKHAAKACSALISEYNRLHKGNTDVLFKDYVDVVRSGDKGLHQGAISPPHTKIIRAFCNTPHFSTAVYTSKCPCSGWLRLRRRTQPGCGSWQGRFAKHG